MMTAKGLEKFLRDSHAQQHYDIDDEIIFCCAFSIIIGAISHFLSRELFDVMPISLIILPFLGGYCIWGGVILFRFKKGVKILIYTQYLYRGCTAILLTLFFLAYIIGYLYAMGDRLLFLLGIFAICGMIFCLTILIIKKGIYRGYVDDTYEENVSKSKVASIGIIGSAGAPLGFFIARLIMSGISDEAAQSSLIPLVVFSIFCICSILGAIIFCHTAYLIRKFKLSHLW